MYCFFYFAVLGGLVSAVPLAWAWKEPTAEQWLMVLAIGLFGTLGQILLTSVYAAAPTTRVAPFTYFSVVFGAAYGCLFRDEVLDLSFVAGALLILFAGVLALQRRAEKIAMDESLDPRGATQSG